MDKLFRQEAKSTYTENGAYAYNSTGSALLDLFSIIGAVRNEPDCSRIFEKFEAAYKEDPLLATKIVFYARDIREGLGERRVPRALFQYMASYHKEALLNNIALIPFYGRWDDLYSIVYSPDPVSQVAWHTIRNQFKEDMNHMYNNEPVSLLAKWIKTPDASSEKTKLMGCETAFRCGFSVYKFKRMLRDLRKYIDITEAKMSTNNWENIDYEKVPSICMLRNKNAFQKHDDDRFKKYIESVSKGEAKINASTLYPYDIISDYWRCFDVDPIREEQWKNLPNWVEGENSAIVMADTSGSMTGRPLDTAVSLAIYFAERNSGPYHNLWMSFSRNPKFHELKGDTLHEKLRNIDQRDWDMNTNLELAFKRILQLAVENKLDPKDMIKSIIVVSDMEIDACTDRNWSFYAQMKSLYNEYGYNIPNIVFWNVYSRNDTFHADANREGVQLCSGSSPSTFKYLMNSIGKTPYQMMLDILNGDRYSPISILHDTDV